MSLLPLRAAIFLAAVVGAAGSPARAQIPTSFSPGDFTYQFADTNGNPISQLSFNYIGELKSLQVLLVQRGGTPTGVMRQLGLQGVGVRLNYSGSSFQVRNGGPSSIIPALSPTTGAPVFDFVKSGGSGTTSVPPASPTDPAVTATSAHITQGLLSNSLPSSPADDPLRFLVGTFVLVAKAPGAAQIQAVDPFAGAHTDILTGPNPANGTPNGPGAISLDQYLGQYAPTPVIPTLTVAVPVPEPSTFALCALGAAGLAVVRRRRSAAS